MNRAEKLKQAGIARYGSEEAWRKALAERGKNGGKAKGDSKRRSTEHYSQAGKRGAAKRWGNESKSL